MDKIIKPIESLRGEIELPGDKSISHRVVLAGSIAKGRMTGSNFLRGDDCLATVSAFRSMGIDIEIKGKKLGVNGKGLKGLRKPQDEIFLGNSGTTMRILPGIIAGQDFEATLTGDESLSKRPMDRIIEPLKKMGADIRSKNKNGLPPLVVKGCGLKGIEYTTKVASAQIKSCILFAGLYADGKTSVTEPFPSRDHTERILKFCGATVKTGNLTACVSGKGSLSGKEIFIPGDISSAAFLIAGACILEGSDVTLREVGINPTRTGFLKALIKMGADITINNKNERVEPFGDIRVRSAGLKPVIVEEGEIPFLIDEVPILAVVASFAKGKSVIRGISELRVKETDRVASMVENLGAMGVDIKAEGASLVVVGKERRLKKATLDSFKDHRTAMSMAIAGLRAEGDCRIKNTDCVNTSFPEFFELLECLGGK